MSGHSRTAAEAPDLSQSAHAAKNRRQSWHSCRTTRKSNFASFRERVTQVQTISKPTWVIIRSGSQPSAFNCMQARKTPAPQARPDRNVASMDARLRFRPERWVSVKIHRKPEGSGACHSFDFAKKTTSCPSLPMRELIDEIEQDNCSERTEFSQP